jgi:hypothetical protein
MKRQSGAFAAVRRAFAAFRSGLARQAFGLQPFAVLMKGPLGRLMIAHGLLGVRAPCGVARLPLLGGVTPGRSIQKIIVHDRYNAAAGTRVPRVDPPPAGV